MTYHRLMPRLSVAALIIVLALLGTFIYRDRDQLSAYAWQPQPVYIALASIAHSISLGFTFFAWDRMMRRIAPNGGGSLRTNFAVYYTTSLAKRIPGTVWYAAGRVALYERLGVGPSLTMAAIVYESALVFLSGLLAILLLIPPALRAGIGSLLTLPGPTALAALAVILAVMVGLMWPGMLERLINLARRVLKREAIAVQASHWDILFWMLLYLAANLIGAAVGFYCIVNIVYPVPLSQFAPIALIGTISVIVGLVSFLVPFIPLAREASVTLLLTAYLPLPVTLIAAILFRLVWTVNDAVWAMLAYRIGLVDATVVPGRDTPEPYPEI
ncbi:MAG: hypothetical protein U0768_13680 [Anaerolineae bacterium]